MDTFGFTPLWSYKHTTEHNVIVSNFESGREQRRYKGPKPDKWRLGFRNTQDVIGQIVAFFDARKGSYEAFLWTPPGETVAKTVRFEEASLEFSYYGSAYAECELTIQEVIE
jgi:phage-related protein